MINPKVTWGVWCALGSGVSQQVIMFDCRRQHEITLFQTSRIHPLLNLSTMHFQTHLIASLFLACGLFVANGVSAQNHPLPLSARDPFHTIEDPKLHAALTVLFNMQPDPHIDEFIGAEEARRIAGIYSQPENLNAIAVVLAAAEKANPDEMEPIVHNYVIGAINAAIISGAEVHIPVLKKLAHSKDKGVRDAVASPDSRGNSPVRSIELLKECLLSAEERLPASIEDLATAEPLLKEFVDRVCTLTTYASEKQRKELTPVVERFLSRYNNRKIEDFYRPRLETYLRGEHTKLYEGDPGKVQRQPREKKDPAARNTGQPASDTPGMKPTLPTPWLVGLLAAAIGLLGYWFMRSKTTGEK